MYIYIFQRWAYYHSTFEDTMADIASHFIVGAPNRRPYEVFNTNQAICRSLGDNIIDHKLLCRNIWQWPATKQAITKKLINNKHNFVVLSCILSHTRVDVCGRSLDISLFISTPVYHKNNKERP